VTGGKSIGGAEVEEGSRLSPKFDDRGLITAVVTDCASGELLLVAHMNDDALQRTLDSGRAWFWSRSRQSLWMKGETSGAVLEVVEIRVDCDQDAVWLRVKRQREANTCHTGRTSCFYRRIAVGKGERVLEPAR
jgi:phosphoribosyl-AMP cyclohydrolase